MIFSADDGCDVGEDTGAPVSPDYGPQRQRLQRPGQGRAARDRRGRRERGSPGQAGGRHPHRDGAAVTKGSRVGGRGSRGEILRPIAQIDLAQRSPRKKKIFFGILARCLVSNVGFWCAIFHERFFKESYMTNMKLVFTALLTALVLGGPGLGQDLDGTLKKIKTSGTLLSATASPHRPSLSQGRTSARWVIPLISAWRSRAPFKSSWGWRISSSIGCRYRRKPHRHGGAGQVDLECGTTTASSARQERVDFSLMTFVDGASLLTAAGTIGAAWPTLRTSASP